jgi:hypothetical protein
MKKIILMMTLVLAFSAQLLHAQSRSIAACPLESECDPDPTPTPPPPPPDPTPTPTPGLFIGPKYVVLSVTYAPPGSASFVTYTGSTLFGSSIAFNRSIANSTVVTTTLTKKAEIFGTNFFGGTSQTFGGAQQADTTISLAVTDSAEESVTVRGPSSSSVGIDHDQDIIWLWLNPALDIRIPSPTTIFWDFFAFDSRDPANGIDLIGIPVGYLNGHVPIPANIADVLARRWAPPILCAASDPECGPDGTKGSGLTAADFAQILKADPFTDPAYLIDISPVIGPSGVICTSDGRFCHIPNVSHTFQYLPPASGGLPTTQTFTETRTANLSQQDNVTVSFSVGFTKQFGTDLSNPLGAINNFLQSLKVVDTLTITDKLSLLNNLQLTQKSAFSITGPTVADHYTGPVELNVFQDNVFGTFMFGAIPQPSFDLAITPSAQNVAQGSCNNYSVSILAKVSGFSSTVNLSAIGLPADVTATFTPSSIAGAGVSTLQLCATTSAGLNTTTFQVKGVSGIEAHSVNASVNVTPAPNYFLTATPTSQSVRPGSPASYNIAVNAQNGFTGNVSLSVTGLPPGAQASFSPVSVAGVSGSSTLTITTLSTTPLGTYTLVVAGISGSLSRSVTISLTVSLTTGNFTLNVLPNSQTVNAGDSAFYTIVASPQNGFTGSITLDASGPGGDIFVDFGPSTISANGSANLTVSTSSTTAPGTYTIFVTGSSGNLNHSTTVTITVNAGCLDRGICPLQ